MKSALLIKVALWLVIIGIFAQITPNPVWPEWLARMIMATGIALAITTALVRWWRGRV